MNHCLKGYMIAWLSQIIEPGFPTGTYRCLNLEYKQKPSLYSKLDFAINQRLYQYLVNMNFTRFLKF